MKKHYYLAVNQDNCAKPLLPGMGWYVYGYDAKSTRDCVVKEKMAKGAPLCIPLTREEARRIIGEQHYYINRISNQCLTLEEIMRWYDRV